MSAERVAEEIIEERNHQDQKWGEQNHPNGTGDFYYRMRADNAREIANYHAEKGILTWKDILDEETSEAFAESDTEKLREELIQVAAVATAWIEAIDRNAKLEEGRKIIQEDKEIYGSVPSELLEDIKNRWIDTSVQPLTASGERLKDEG